MGGLAGRADAMYGAVECQKSTGSLQYHFFLFVQRLHQYASMREIAELAEKHIITAQELKDCPLASREELDLVSIEKDG